MGKGSEIRVGTSGWSYPHWRQVFYPAGLPQGEWLRHYARRLNSVEINNTFYALPPARTLRQWREEVPAGFVFAVKGSRYITHMRKLREPRASTAAFLRRIRVLGERCGPVLFQLPPRWRCAPERLRRFLEALPRTHRYAFEFRDRSWHRAEVYRLLERHHAAFCIYDLAGFTSPRAITTDFAYVRLHGPDGPYRGSYGDRALDDWARVLSDWHDAGLDCYCYFDNDEQGYAPMNALALQGRLGDRALPRAG